MKTADKRGKEKRNLSDYFELTEQTYENHQGSLFKKKRERERKRPSLSKPSPNLSKTQNLYYFILTQILFGGHNSVTSALDVLSTHAGVISG